MSSFRIGSPRAGKERVSRYSDEDSSYFDDVLRSFNEVSRSSGRATCMFDYSHDIDKLSDIFDEELIDFRKQIARNDQIARDEKYARDAACLRRTTHACKAV